MTRRRPMAEINVVPYIDVSLVLLVIFMIAAPLLTQGIAVDLPEVEADRLEVAQREPLQVWVLADGSYRLDLGASGGTETVLEELGRRVAILLERNPNLPVLVRGDAAVSYGAVMDLMSALRLAGVEDVGLVTDPPVDR